MKIISIVTVIVALGLVTSCRKSHDPKKDSIQLNQCKEYKFGSETVNLCFDQLVEDSRCPVNLMCIWEGVAKANFTFIKGQQSHRIRLATSAAPGPERPDTTINGYKIELLNIEPYPKHPRVHFPDSDVKATVRITKI